MSEKILFVDDEPDLLAAYQRHLRKAFEIETAEGPERGLAAVAERGPFAVIVSDLRMPNMDGIQFLSLVKKKAPNSVRIMLTGCADLETSIAAVNEGNIFRFLTKPCQPNTLVKALTDGAKQYQLVMAERELLEKTLKGSINILMEILTLVNADLFGRSAELKTLIASLAETIEWERHWEIETAAMLSQIGFVGVPPEILVKSRQMQHLPPTEMEILESMPGIGARLLANIPRMDAISKIILYQNKRFDGMGFPPDAVKGKDIPLGGRVLKILSDLIEVESQQTPRPGALKLLRERKGWYDPELFDAICKALSESGAKQKARNEAPYLAVKMSDLRPGHILYTVIETVDGQILYFMNHVLSQANLERVKSYNKFKKVKEPILVINPDTQTPK